MVVHSLLGKTYLIMIKLKTASRRDTSKAGSLRRIDIFFITRPSEQKNDDFNTEEIGEIGQYEGGIVVLDDMLAYNQKAIHPLFTG